jgi:hypothetical protein
MTLAELTAQMLLQLAAKKKGETDAASAQARETGLSDAATGSERCAKRARPGDGGPSTPRKQPKPKKPRGLRNVEGRTELSQCEYLNWASASWKRKGTCCSKHCHLNYASFATYLLRCHLTGRPHREQAKFITDRRSARPQADGQADTTSTYWLETSAVLQRRVQRANSEKVLVAGSPPVEGEKRKVCLHFLLFMAGVRSINFAYKQPKPDPGMHEKPRLKKRYVGIKEFFDDARERYEQMPHTGEVILPFRTRRQVHAAYVLTLLHGRGECVKHLMGPPDPLEDHPDADDSDEDHSDEDQSDEEEQGTSLEGLVTLLERDDDVHPDDASYAYGNPELGLRGDTPQNLGVASLSHFNTVWQSDLRDKSVDPLRKMSNVKTRKWMPFAKCTTCVENRRLHCESGCPIEKQRLSQEHRDHVQFIRREREVYWAIRAKARRNPTMLASLCIDAADQSDFHLPHFSERDKRECGAWKVKTHVVAALIHGHPPLVFVSGNQCKQGHNVTIQALWECLLYLKAHGGIPPTVYLQLDNTTKQNKGKYLVAFCEVLVACGVTDHMILNFLPVGHTHEDVDQLFSAIARRLRIHDAVSLYHLMAQIRSGFKDKFGCRPTVTTWDSVANISEWLNNEKVMPLPYVTEYRCFEITRSSAGKPEVRVRKNMGDLGALDPLRGAEDDHRDYPVPFSTCWGATDGIVPNINGADIPDAQRSKDDPERAKKLVSGIDDKLKNVPKRMYPDEARAENLALAALEVDTAISLPFEWNREYIRSIFCESQPSAEAEKVAEPEPEPRVKPIIAAAAIKKDDYYLVAPFEKEDNYPFYLCQIKGRQAAGGDDDDDDDDDDDSEEESYHVQYLEVAAEDNGRSFKDLEEFVNATYQLQGGEGRRAATYPTIRRGLLLQKIEMVGAAGKKGKRKIKAAGDSGKKAVRAWGVQINEGLDEPSSNSDSDQ